jgi:hypothetical protein
MRKSMRRELAVALLIVSGLAASGCSSAPVDIVEYHSGQPPQITSAPGAETYTLIADSRLRIESTTFAVADDIGFVRQCGKLEAVAGDERIPLADGNYSWVIEQSRFKGFSPFQGSLQPARGRGALGGAAAATIAWLALGSIDAAARAAQ